MAEEILGVFHPCRNPLARLIQADKSRASLVARLVDWLAAGVAKASGK